MNGQVRIDEMFAFIVVDDDQTEGIPALKAEMGGALPMVGANLEMIEKLRPHAEMIARVMGKKVTVAKFTNRVDLEEIV